MCVSDGWLFVIVGLTTKHRSCGVMYVTFKFLTVHAKLFNSRYYALSLLQRPTPTGRSHPIAISFFFVCWLYLNQGPSLYEQCCWRNCWSWWSPWVHQPAKAMVEQIIFRCYICDCPLWADDVICHDTTDRGLTRLELSLGWALGVEQDNIPSALKVCWPGWSEGRVVWPRLLSIVLLCLG